jgi:hypothetical protein
MEIFRVVFMPTRYQALRYSEPPTQDESDIFLFGGDQAARWRVREVRPNESAFIRPDIWRLEGTPGTMAFPQKVVDALEPQLSTSGVLLPLALAGKREPFFALDITRIVDCLDTDESTIGVLSLRLSFDPTRLLQPGLFKVPELATSELLYFERGDQPDTFRGRIESSALSGLQLESVWDSVSGPRDVSLIPPD